KLDLIDQTGMQGMRGECWTANREITGAFRLEFSHRLRIETAFQGCLLGRYRFKGGRIDNLVRLRPDSSVFPEFRFGTVKQVRIFPERHDLVHATPQEEG